MGEEEEVIPGVPYDLFTGAFLSKTTEYEFSGITDFERTAAVDGYMKQAITTCPLHFTYRNLPAICEKNVWKKQYLVNILRGCYKSIADVPMTIRTWSR